MLAALIKHKWFGAIACALLTGLVGWVLVAFAPGRFLMQYSYDIPYSLRPRVAVTNVAVVYVDANSLKRLDQPNWPPDRRIYASLVRRLKEAGARMILFDIVFRASRPEADPEFAAALRDHGNVLLGGLYDTSRQQDIEAVGVSMGQVSPPVPMLRTNARAWGLLAMRPVDYSFSSRRIFAGINIPGVQDLEFDSMVWTAAKLDQAAITRDPLAKTDELWLNFYGPAYSLRSAALEFVLNPEADSASLANFFKDAVVFVGGHPSLSTQIGERDAFATPFSRLRSGSGAESAFMPGVELHATAYANLVRGDYLRRIPINAQVIMVIVWGLGLSLVLSRLSARPAVLVAVGVGLGLMAIAIGLQIYGGRWFTWVVPAIVQPALALGLNITYRYAVESRQRKQLRAAFAAYVTPEVAEQVISRGIDLAPGGDECMVTIMFTDVQSFTDISERVTPKELSLMLSHYFEDAANCVLSQQGTVIKFIGDSVLAIWGAPISREDHAARAVRAALGINQLGQKHYYGHELITRIGINTGNALVGNLGSRIRFDYTVIGASVNYASRLEGMNKYFGTTFLISESTRLLLDDSFQVRCLGRFVAKGTISALPVFEVLDWHEKPQPSPPWCETFARALVAFQNHDLITANNLFQQVIRERNGNDGPSAYYLNYIAGLSPEHSTKEWAGVVIMTDK